MFSDWKDQPDFDALEWSVNSLLAKDATRVYFTLARTDDDSNCVVVSDSKLSVTDATRAREDYDDSLPEDGPDQSDQPFVWHPATRA